MRIRLAIAVALALVAPHFASAQIKLPVYDEGSSTLKNVVFEDAVNAGDFQHGRLVRVAMNGSSKDTVEGILVRVDRKNDRVYVRTRPGAAPDAFSVKNIKKIEKGVIREVNFHGEAIYPEISQMVVYNGGKKTVTYNAPTLSASEIARLSEIETAENKGYRTSLEVAHPRALPAARGVGVPETPEQRRWLEKFAAGLKLVSP